MLQERVLLAERALLYAFAFDFRNGDPFSFALKYNRLHSADNLVDPDAAETFFAWLTFAGQATTLCLQYPPSLLAVASLWYAQHLSRGQVCVTQLPKRTCMQTGFPSPSRGSLTIAQQHMYTCTQGLYVVATLQSIINIDT